MRLCIRLKPVLAIAIDFVMIDEIILGSNVEAVAYIPTTERAMSPCGVIVDFAVGDFIKS
jgi:hypothetical protein